MRIARRDRSLPNGTGDEVATRGLLLGCFEVEPRHLEDGLGRGPLDPPLDRMPDPRLRSAATRSNDSAWGLLPTTSNG